jgi:hypothetical protein
MIKFRRGIKTGFIRLDEPDQTAFLEYSVFTQPGMMPNYSLMLTRLHSNNGGSPGNNRRLDGSSHQLISPGNIVAERSLQIEWMTP